MWIVIPVGGGVYNGAAAFPTRQAALDYCIHDAQGCRESDDPEWHLIEVTGDTITAEMSFAFGFYDAYDYGPDVDPRALCIAEMEDAKTD